MGLNELTMEMTNAASELGKAAVTIKSGECVMKIHITGGDIEGSYQFIVIEVVPLRGELKGCREEEEVWEFIEGNWATTIPEDFKLLVSDAMEDALIIEREGPIGAMHAIAKRAELRAKEAG